MYRVITIEREFGSGAGEIARELASRLGWKLWDHALTEEIAKLAQVDCSAVERREERVDSTFHRLAKVFWRGSYERSMSATGLEIFDADCLVRMGQQVVEKAAAAGNCVIVGRGAPYFLREYPDAFHVFLYAPRAEKLRRLRLIGKSEKEAEELLDTVDRDRITFVKHYFGADWPARCLYHVMINTAIGNENVISTILNTMHTLERTLVGA
ncbi:MAG TPA: cytidylate kinase-like family protein [Terriglobales bacterium]|nr:cytidylate kinase-like family protein [Terriglobales bacterium]